MSSIKTAIVYSYYFINPDNFTALFCENTDKPELECNGKCYLKKVTQNQLESSKDDSLPVVNLDLKNILLYFYPNQAVFEVNSTEIQESTTLFYYTNLYTFQVNHSIFHPPNNRFYI